VTSASTQTEPGAKQEALASCSLPTRLSAPFFEKVAIRDKDEIALRTGQIASF
jgi:hypothetical protein